MKWITISYFLISMMMKNSFMLVESLKGVAIKSLWLNRAVFLISIALGKLIIFSTMILTAMNYDISSHHSITHSSIQFLSQQLLGRSILTHEALLRLWNIMANPHSIQQTIISMSAHIISKNSYKPIHVLSCVLIDHNMLICIILRREREVRSIYVMGMLRKFPISLFKRKHSSQMSIRIEKWHCQIVYYMVIYSYHTTDGSGVYHREYWLLKSRPSGPPPGRLSSFFGFDESV